MTYQEKIPELWQQLEDRCYIRAIDGDHVDTVYEIDWRRFYYTEFAVMDRSLPDPFRFRVNEGWQIRDPKYFIKPINVRLQIMEGEGWGMKYQPNPAKQGIPNFDDTRPGYILDRYLVLTHAQAGLLLELLENRPRSGELFNLGWLPADFERQLIRERVIIPVTDTKFYFNEAKLETASILVLTGKDPAPRMMMSAHPFTRTDAGVVAPTRQWSHSGWFRRLQTSHRSALSEKSEEAWKNFIANSRRTRWVWHCTPETARKIAALSDMTPIAYADLRPLLGEQLYDVFVKYGVYDMDTNSLDVTMFAHTKFVVDEGGNDKPRKATPDEKEEKREYVQWKEELVQQLEQYEVRDQPSAAEQPQPTEPEQHQPAVLHVRKLLRKGVVLGE